MEDVALSIISRQCLGYDPDIIYRKEYLDPCLGKVLVIKYQASASASASAADADGCYGGPVFKTFKTIIILGKSSLGGATGPCGIFDGFLGNVTLVIKPDEDDQASGFTFTKRDINEFVKLPIGVFNIIQQYLNMGQSINFGYLHKEHSLDIADLFSQYVPEKHPLLSLVNDVYKSSGEKQFANPVPLAEEIFFYHATQHCAAVAGEGRLSPSVSGCLGSAVYTSTMPSNNLSPLGHGIRNRLKCKASDGVVIAVDSHGANLVTNILCRFGYGIAWYCAANKIRTDRMNHALQIFMEEIFTRAIDTYKSIKEIFIEVKNTPQIGENIFVLCDRLKEHCPVMLNNIFFEAVKDFIYFHIDENKYYDIIFAICPELQQKWDTALFTFDIDKSSEVINNGKSEGDINVFKSFIAMHLSRSLNVWLGDVCVDDMNNDDFLSPESLSKDFNPLAPLLGPLLHCELSYCGIEFLISRYTNILGKIVSLQLSSLGIELRIVGNGLPTAEVGITHLIPHKIYSSQVENGMVSFEEDLAAKISDSPSATNGLPSVFRNQGLFSIPTGVKEFSAQKYVVSSFIEKLYFYSFAYSNRRSGAILIDANDGIARFAQILAAYNNEHFEFNWVDVELKCKTPLESLFLNMAQVVAHSFPSVGSKVSLPEYFDFIVSLKPEPEKNKSRIIACVCGTRPEVVKLIPVVNELEEAKVYKVHLVDTGQQPDLVPEALASLERDADFNLKIFAGGQALTLALIKTIQGLSEYIEEHKPEVLVCTGDPIAPLATAIIGAIYNIPVVHFESGLRVQQLTLGTESGEMSSWTRCARPRSPFPEEIYRQVISRSVFNCCPTVSNVSNLIYEGIPEKYIKHTGITNVDNVRGLIKSIDEAVFINFFIEGEYLRPDKNAHNIVVTCHRRENVSSGALQALCIKLCEIAKHNPEIKIFFPMHPNPKLQDIIKKHLGGMANVCLMPQLSPGMFAYLCANFAKVIISDSGGIQEEVFELRRVEDSKIICPSLVVYRDSSERPESFACNSKAILLPPDKVDDLPDLVHKLLLSPVELDIGALNIYAGPAEGGNASARIAAVVREAIGAIEEDVLLDAAAYGNTPL